MEFHINGFTFFAIIGSQFLGSYYVYLYGTRTNFFFFAAKQKVARLSWAKSSSNDGISFLDFAHKIFILKGT